MDKVVIKAERIGKRYIISHEKRAGYTALRDVISDKAKAVLGTGRLDFKTQEEFWALKDISFEIAKGEAVGIIGRNGAGKSTLLKILSRITEPSAGKIGMNGRIASLLEVGTGFHPELTGKENIFLNGAILGMSRAEIRKKFDEIVDFSGVEKFLDTPVKRYSSGMYVRLAFSVAAHLEPEILVVDEVLAVGDAEFQQKCLGKMSEVSKNSGRTVLFVSHNMAAIESLCSRAIVLNGGTIHFDGAVRQALMEYKSAYSVTTGAFDFSNHKTGGESDIRICSLDTYNEAGNKAGEFYPDERIVFKIGVESSIDTTVSARVTFFNEDDYRVMALDSADLNQFFVVGKGVDTTITCSLNEQLYIRPGRYRINISLKKGAMVYDHIVGVKHIQLLEKDVYGYGRFSMQDFPLVIKKHSWLQEGSS